MINIKRFVCNMFQENCYVVHDESLECVIIDCGAYHKEEREAIVRYITEHQLRPVHLLATHGHLDHNFGNDTIKEAFGLSVELAEGDVEYLEKIDEQAAAFGLTLDYKLPAAAEKTLKEGDKIRFGSHTLQVLETPGHSQGSVTFYCKEEHIAFTGDTLFRHSIGRTDFAGGNMFQIINSLRMMAQLPDETVVYAGHGETTSIGEELAHNPYMDR